MTLYEKHILYYLWLLLFCGLLIYGAVSPEGFTSDKMQLASHPVLRFVEVMGGAAFALLAGDLCSIFLVNHRIELKRIYVDEWMSDYTKQKFKRLKILHWSTLACSSVAIAVIDAVRTNM